MASLKLCDSCQSARATLFCRADSAFLCVNCDAKIHAANKLASRHARVWMCEVCEQAPAHVTCKADAAALCVTCDRDIHSANSLASRHHRTPVVPFYNNYSSSSTADDDDGDDGNRFAEANVSSEEAEAASWLLPDPKPTEEEEEEDGEACEYVFPEVDSYLDLDCGKADLKAESRKHNISGTDCVVPVENLMVKENRFDLDFSGSKLYPFPAYNCLSHSVSSPSLEVGVVPVSSPMVDVSNSYTKAPQNTAPELTIQTAIAVQLSPADREARVLRYREKRKNRKFEKTIRYASRKAYAEMRPRIKGRFAKQSGTDVEAADQSSAYGYGVVPSF